MSKIQFNIEVLYDIQKEFFLFNINTRKTSLIMRNVLKTLI
jgi:hypothetical protein